MKTPSLKSLALALSALAAPALTVLPASAQTAIKVTLPWVFQGPDSFMLVAVDKGYYKEEGLDVTVDAGRGSVDALNKVASGAYEFGFADLGNLVQFHGFTLLLRGDVLQRRYGLLTTRQKTLPRARVQRVTIEQTWLRRLAGFAVVKADSAGGSRSDGQDNSGGWDVVVPLTRTSSVGPCCASESSPPTTSTPRSRSSSPNSPS